jgi:hypothetical protein
LQEKGNLDALYFWFQQYDLAGFNPNRCEHTATLTSMIEQSRSMLDIELTDWLESNKVFKMDMLKNVFNESPDKVKRKLEELGYRQARIYTNGQNVDRSRYWFPGLETKKGGTMVRGKKSRWWYQTNDICLIGANAPFLFQN